MIHCHVTHPVRMRVQDLPGSLITAELAQLVKEFTREDHRMAPMTTIRGQGNAATVRPPVRRHLVDHDWPGNVRELRNFAFSAVLDLPRPGVAPAPEAGTSLPERVGRFEAAIIRESLAATGGSIVEALKLLGIPARRSTTRWPDTGSIPRAFGEGAPRIADDCEEGPHPS